MPMPIFRCSNSTRPRDSSNCLPVFQAFGPSARASAHLWRPSAQIPSVCWAPARFCFSGAQPRPTSSPSPVLLYQHFSLSISLFPFPIPSLSAFPHSPFIHQLSTVILFHHPPIFISYIDVIVPNQLPFGSFGATSFYFGSTLFLYTAQPNQSPTVFIRVNFRQPFFRCFLSSF